jgi:hypothetical protein
MAETISRKMGAPITLSRAAQALKFGRGIASMRLGTIQTLHKKFWQWMKDQIVRDVPASDELCEYDCRKQLCTEEEWATCERRIQRAIGELRPDRKPAQTSPTSSKLTNYHSILSQSEKEETLAWLKCPHRQPLLNCEGLAQAVVAEMHHCGIEYRRADGDNRELTDPEFIEAVRLGIDRFLRNSFGTQDNDESCPPAA